MIKLRVVSASLPARSSCWRRFSNRLAWLPVLLYGPGPAMAASDFVPYAEIQGEYDSNIFSVSGHEEGRELGADQLDDRLLRSIAGLLVDMPFSAQKLSATFEARRYSFSNYSRLDHNETQLNGRFDWKLTRLLKGAIDYQQERRMASFANRRSTSLFMERERVGRADASLAITPEWRLEGGFQFRNLDSPLVASPDFKLFENTMNAALKYRVIKTMHAGVALEQTDGHYHGLSDQRRFVQRAGSATLDYEIGEWSHLSASAGYTRRKDKTSSFLDASGGTGSLSYRRQFTPKTSGRLIAFRRIASFGAGATSMRETGGRANVDWQATTHTSLALAYQWRQDEYESLASDTRSTSREDEVQLASLSVTTQPLRWLSVRPYAEYRLRDSNASAEEFQGNILGIEIRARLP